jgi:hypothetical protein
MSGASRSSKPYILLATEPLMRAATAARSRTSSASEPGMICSSMISSACAARRARRAAGRPRCGPVAVTSRSSCEATGAGPDRTSSLSLRQLTGPACRPADMQQAHRPPELASALPGFYCGAAAAGER